MQNFGADGGCCGLYDPPPVEEERANRLGVSSLVKNSSTPNEFLIVTLPIRIATKSIPCIIGAHSNRHSSEAPNLSQSGAIDQKIRRSGGSGNLAKILPLEGSSR